MKLTPIPILILFFLWASVTWAQSSPQGMVVSQESLASKVGAQVLKDGGNAVDASVATAFALAVTHPIAGNIGGGGFLLLRKNDGKAEVIDFRETAPRKSHPGMFLRNGKYDEVLHHESHLSVGVPGTVRGLRLAWKRHGSKPWASLLRPAIRLAKEGFPICKPLADALKEYLPKMQPYTASMAQFTRHGQALEAGDRLCLPDLARTLMRLARDPEDFYKGKTARLIVKDMKAHGGLITLKDLAEYAPRVREPLRGSYRGVELLAVPPPSSGGMVIFSVLNQLEAFDLKAMPEADRMHLMAEAMRRAYQDRAQWLGDPDFNPGMPLAQLISKQHAAQLRQAIDLAKATPSSLDNQTTKPESEQTTHFSIVDGSGNAVSLTYTLEDHFGSRIVVPGAGFLLNNEMGDFNAEPGRTDTTGLIGTKPNLAMEGKRMLSSMCPVILVKDGRLLMVTGSPGGRTIPNTVLQTILNVVDLRMSAQDAVNAPRIHHQWLPDRIAYEQNGLKQETLQALQGKGHQLFARPSIGSAQVIVVRADGSLEGAADTTRWSDSCAAGVEQNKDLRSNEPTPKANRE